MYTIECKQRHLIRNCAVKTAVKLTEIVILERDGPIPRLNNGVLLHRGDLCSKDNNNNKSIIEENGSFESLFDVEVKERACTLLKVVSATPTKENPLREPFHADQPNWPAHCDSIAFKIKKSARFF